MDDKEFRELRDSVNNLAIAIAVLTEKFDASEKAKLKQPCQYLLQHITDTNEESVKKVAIKTFVQSVVVGGCTLLVLGFLEYVKSH